MVKKLRNILLVLCLVSLVWGPVFATVTPTETKRQYFVCDGSTTTFTFTMQVNSSDDIKVEKVLISTGDPTTLLEDTHYTIAATSSDYLNGGVVTISSALATTYRVVITRDIVLTQETSSGAINAASVELALDKLTRALQDASNDRNQRTIRIPDSDPTTAWAELTDYVSRAGYWLGFDSTTGAPYAGTPAATGISVSAFMVTVNDDATAAAAVATLHTTQIVNIMNPAWSVAGNGATNDTTALNTALATVVDGDTVYFRPGTYLCNNLDTLIDLDGVRFVGYGVILKAPDDDTTGHCLNFDTCTDITIEGFEFNRRNSYNSGQIMRGIGLTDCNDVLVKQCVFDECWIGVRTLGTACERVHVDKCRMYGRLDYSAGNESNYLTAYSVLDLTVTSTDCSITNCRTYQARVIQSSDGVDTNTLVDKNISRESGGSDIYLQGTRGTITNNIIIDAGKDAIKCIGSGAYTLIATNQIHGAGIDKSDGGSSILFIGTGGNALITNNIIQFVADASVAVARQVGINVQGEGISIVGNYLRGSADNTITGIFARNQIMDTNNVLISGNNSRGMSPAISVSATGAYAIEDILIEGNIITEVGQGISIIGDAAMDACDVTVRGNTVTDWTSWGINAGFTYGTHITGNRVTAGSNAYVTTGCHNMVYNANYGEEQLLNVIDVNFAIPIGQTTLYTVPSGEICAVTKVVIVVGGDAGETDITIGKTASWDDWLGANGIAGGDLALDNADAAGDVVVISPGTFIQTPAAANITSTYTAGEVIKLDVTAGEGNTSNKLFLFGILY